MNYLSLLTTVDNELKTVNLFQEEKSLVHFNIGTLVYFQIINKSILQL